MYDPSAADITRIVSEAALAACQALGTTDAARCCLVYEEAHSLVPEWNAVASEGDKTAANGSARAILQGRKFGLGCLLVTQRTASVTKTILNQCNTIFAMRVFDATGMDFLANYIGPDSMPTYFRASLTAMRWFLASHRRVTIQWLSGSTTGTRSFLCSEQSSTRTSKPLQTVPEQSGPRSNRKPKCIRPPRRPHNTRTASSEPTMAAMQFSE